MFSSFLYISSLVTCMKTTSQAFDSKLRNHILRAFFGGRSYTRLFYLGGGTQARVKHTPFLQARVDAAKGTGIFELEVIYYVHMNRVFNEFFNKYEICLLIKSIMKFVIVYLVLSCTIWFFNTETTFYFISALYYRVPQENDRRLDGRRRA